MTTLVILLYIFSHNHQEQASLDNEILGTWTVYVTESNGMTIQCNQCPQMEFETNTNATLSFPDSSNEYYFWTLIDENLTLKFNKFGNKSTDFFFNAADYNLDFAEKPKYFELTLNDGNQKYTLRKIKTGANKM